MTTINQASKAMPKEQKELGSIMLVKKARVEKNLQARLDRMHVDVKRGTVPESVVAEKINEEIAKLTKLEETLKELELQPISNYAALKLLNDTLLSGVTEGSLAADYAVKARKFKDQAFGELNPAQIAVVDAYFGIQARKELTVIKTVRRVLDHVSKRTQGIAAIAPTLQTEPAMAN